MSYIIIMFMVMVYRYSITHSPVELKVPNLKQLYGVFFILILTKQNITGGEMFPDTPVTFVKSH